MLTNREDIKDIVVRDYPQEMLIYLDKAMKKAILERLQTRFCILTTNLATTLGTRSD